MKKFPEFDVQFSKSEKDGWEEIKVMTKFEVKDEEGFTYEKVHKKEVLVPLENRVEKSVAIQEEAKAEVLEFQHNVVLSDLEKMLVDGEGNPVFKLKEQAAPKKEKKRMFRGRKKKSKDNE